MERDNRDMTTAAETRAAEMRGAGDESSGDLSDPSIYRSPSRAEGTLVKSSYRRCIVN